MGTPVDEGSVADGGDGCGEMRGAGGIGAARGGDGERTRADEWAEFFGAGVGVAGVVGGAAGGVVFVAAAASGCAGVVDAAVEQDAGGHAGELAVSEVAAESAPAVAVIDIGGAGADADAAGGAGEGEPEPGGGDRDRCDGEHADAGWGTERGDAAGAGEGGGEEAGGCDASGGSVHAGGGRRGIVADAVGIFGGEVGAEGVDRRDSAGGYEQRFVGVAVAGGDAFSGAGGGEWGRRRGGEDGGVAGGEDLFVVGRVGGARAGRDGDGQ